MVDERRMIKAKFEHIRDYPEKWYEQIFIIMSLKWKKDNCECGVPHRDIGNAEHRKMMEVNNWGPMAKGPRWWYNFDGNVLVVTYWCHGCKKTSKERLKHTDQHQVDYAFELFKEHNPEYIEELFIIEADL